MSEFGRALLFLAFGTSLYAFIALVLSNLKGDARWKESGIRGLQATVGVLTVASIALVSALIRADYSLQYVALQVSPGMGLTYRIAAFWAGMDGSMLFWSWVLSLYILALLWETRQERHDPLHSWAYASLALSLSFFVFIAAVFSNPFKPAEMLVSEGRGMNPLLMNVWMHTHPVALYLGYTGLAIPFSYAMAALLAERVDNTWVRFIRKWTLIPWVFLTIGIILGGRWAYLELGWGGYWAWDPVENASFMPWLTATAFLHSIIVQEKRGMLKIWNINLAVITFLFALIGTYITRSGALTSVHAFAESELGPWFAGAIWSIAVVAAGLLYMKRHRIQSEHRLETLFSREGFFLINNWVFLALALTVAWGTLFPIVSEAFTGIKVTVGQPFFNSVTPPLFLLLIFLMTVAPIISWRRASSRALVRSLAWPTVLALLTGGALGIGMRAPLIPLLGYTLASWTVYTTLYEVFRVGRARARRKGIPLFRGVVELLRTDHRRYGGYIVHVGVALIAIGIVGSSAFRQRLEKEYPVGSTFSFEGFQIAFKDIQQGIEPDYRYSRATLEVTDPLGKSRLLYPEYRFYFKWNMNTAEVALWPHWSGDFYAVLNGYDEDQRMGLFVLFWNPLVGFLWVGGLLVVFGGFYALLPSHRRNRSRLEQEQPV